MSTKNLKKFLEGQGYSKPRRRVGIVLIFLVIVLIGFGSYFLFYYSKPCSDSECFYKSLENCKRVSWVRNDNQGTWLYEMIGGDSDSCDIRVSLIQLKEGNINSEKIVGKDMVCDMGKSDKFFPEEDIRHCSGKLKEELQDIIIQRMHNYLLENIGEIQAEFSRV